MPVFGPVWELPVATADAQMTSVRVLHLQCRCAVVFTGQPCCGTKSSAPWLLIRQEPAPLKISAADASLFLCTRLAPSLTANGMSPQVVSAGGGGGGTFALGVSAVHGQAVSAASRLHQPVCHRATCRLTTECSFAWPKPLAVQVTLNHIL